ncbi:MAG TPA: hypothetical protein VK911_01245, partial [Vicinamibacterales bacterium]|nr:hypothetical protein [Vicinamibacterales bacterium]
DARNQDRDHVVYRRKVDAVGLRAGRRRCGEEHRKATDEAGGVAEAGERVRTFQQQLQKAQVVSLRLLSLDGITDGKVYPYLAGGDLTPFLWKYRPDYWLANYAVAFRPYLSNSILGQVYRKIGEQPEGEVVEIDGITFQNVKHLTEPDVAGFAGFRQLIKLTYSR